MDINDILLNGLSTVENMANRRYWFVRTDSGDFFETYLENGFLAIGWNEITLQDLRNIDVYSPAIRQKVRANPENGIQNVENAQSQESKITTILNKNRAFVELQRGDVVIMPSEGSHYLAFGIVDDTSAYNGTGNNCPYHKRRRVRWLKSESIKFLDAKFAYIKKTFHAISEIDESYHDIIDNFMFDTYIKHGFGNISLKLKIQDEINYSDLKELLDNLIAIAQQYNLSNGITNEDLQNATIKLNLQSPGFVNLKNAGFGLIYAVAIVLASCKPNGTSEKNNADQIIIVNGIDSTKVDSAVALLRDFHVEAN